MPRNPPDHYALWLSAAAEVERTDNPLNIPYDIALQEASAAAGFVTKYWEPEPGRPGLRRVAKRLPRKTADDTLSLIAAVQAAQTRLLMLVDPQVADRGDRARYIVNELESALVFLLDDDVDEPADQQLASLQEFHSQDGQRSSALIQKLRDYSSLAATLKDRLVEIDEDFDPSLITEAAKLADDMAAHPVADAPASAKASAATKVRNQMLWLLADKVKKIRKAAARVFEHHPTLVREVGSAYERRRRAAARRLKKAADTAPAEQPPK